MLKNVNDKLWYGFSEPVKTIFGHPLFNGIENEILART